MTPGPLRTNPWLVLGAAATALAALAHLACIAIGPSAYRTMGAGPLLEPYFPGNSDAFWFWSSAICLVIGLMYLVGLRRAWKSPGR